MDGITRILVPVDFSATAQKAFRFALRLGALLGAELHLLHVIYPQMENIDDPLMPSGRATIAKKNVAEKKIEGFIEAGKASWSKTGEILPTIVIHVEVGGAIAVIKSQARKQGFDLIVMGTRGEHASVENLLGTVASDVVGNAPCPVIVVPEYTEERGITRIAHAVEPQWVKSKDVERIIRRFLPIHQEVHLVRFSDLKDEPKPLKLTKLKESLEKEFAGISISVHKMGEQNLSEDLNNFAEKENIDLLVMYRSTSGFFRKLFHRSRSREMAKKTHVPLLVV